MTKTIKDLLPSILNQENNWRFTLLNNWHTIFGPLSDKVCLEKIYDDTLILGIEDSCWLQELYLLSEILLQTINKTLDQPRIKHLRFKVVGLKRSKVRKQLEKKAWSTQTRALTAQEKKALLGIKDPLLEQALKSFLLRCYRERE